MAQQESPPKLCSHTGRLGRIPLVGNGDTRSERAPARWPVEYVVRCVRQGCRRAWRARHGAHSAETPRSRY